jgi:hypothetical protein
VKGWLKMPEISEKGIRVRLNVSRTSKLDPSWDLTVEVNDNGMTLQELDELPNRIAELRRMLQGQAVDQDAKMLLHFAEGMDKKLAAELKASLGAS